MWVERVGIGNRDGNFKGPSCLPLLEHFCIILVSAVIWYWCERPSSCTIVPKNNSCCWSKWSGPTGEIGPRKSDSGLSNYPSLGIKGSFVIFDKESRWLLTKICRMRFHNLCSSLYCETWLPRSCFSCHDGEVACEIRSLPYNTYEATTASAWAAKSAAVTGCRPSISVLQSGSLAWKVKKLPLQLQGPTCPSSTSKKPFLLHQQLGSRILPNLL